MSIDDGKGGSEMDREVRVEANAVDVVEWSCCVRRMRL